MATASPRPSPVKRATAGVLLGAPSNPRARHIVGAPVWCLGWAYLYAPKVFTV
jgi:hypothetical protein